MAKRWAPILGITGFDGGSKPAISLATRTGRLIGGEGEQTQGDQGPGACCYDDGTCDDLFEFDCVSAGGTWQGPGTTCEDTQCTGACCEPGCVEDTTPEGCEADGGTFQGFGTTCDPDPCPPTGACCDDDGNCTITTEEDCTGTYQGDDTVCDPNPCLSPCSCGFDAFDGSGRKFLTRTTVASGSYDAPSANPSCPRQTNDWSSTKVETQDPDTCEVTCESCSGSATCHTNTGGTPCSDDCVISGTADCDGATYSCGFGSSSITDYTLCGWNFSPSCDSSSIPAACATCSSDESISSATEKVLSWSCNPAPGDVNLNATQTITLSDECTTEFSPPP